MNTLFELGKIQMLSLWQPWAQLCVWVNPIDGKAEKRVETRHWTTGYRGLLAIHATKTLTPDAKFELGRNEEMQAALLRHGYHPSEHGAKKLPMGVIVGVAELYKVVQMDAENQWLSEDFAEREKSFGFYEPGRFGWCLRNPIEFSQPIVCRGLQGLGAPPFEIRTLINEAMNAAPKKVNSDTF